MAMTRNSKDKQNEFVFLTLDEMVPKNHIVRKMERHFDFTFIYEKVSDKYSNLGQKSLDPVIFFKILFIRYMFGIKSIRETMRQIEVNAAYRWYLGIPFGKDVPCHSTISQTYRRRFKDCTIFEDIFNQVLNIAIESGYIAFDDIHADATHIKAYANKRKYTEEEVDVVQTIKSSMLDEINEIRKVLDKESIELEDDVANDDEDDSASLPSTKEVKKVIKKSQKKIKVSKTDADAGYYYRDEKEKGFVYQDHRVVDGKYNFILGTMIEPGNVHDAKVLEKLLGELKANGFKYNSIALDSGYNSLEIMKTLNDDGAFSVIAHRRFGPTKKKSKATYDKERDVFVCESGCVFPLRNVDKNGYKIYHDINNCRNCPNKCFSASAKLKIYRRHIHQDLREVVNKQNRLSPRGKALYKKRKETVERSFADGKQNHGMRWTLYKGKKKNQNYSWILCAVQNLKKICKLKSIEYAIEQDSALTSLLTAVVSTYGSLFEEINSIKAPKYI